MRRSTSIFWRPRLISLRGSALSYMPSVKSERSTRTEVLATAAGPSRRFAALRNLVAIGARCPNVALGASVGGSRREPLGQLAVLLEPDKTPSQLDHAAAD